MADVLEIRRLYGTGLFSQSQLAKQFGRAQYVIWAIVHRRLWKHC
jgi:hypothetical protein